MTINPLDPSIDVKNRIKEVCSLLNGGQNEQAFAKLSQLSDEGKVQFNISNKTEENEKMPKTFENVNAEQQNTQAQVK